MITDTNHHPTATPPPGWYPDPTTPGMLRRWDGFAWGTERQSAAPIPTPHPVPPPTVSPIVAAPRPQWHPSQGPRPPRRTVGTGLVMTVAVLFGALLSVGVAAGAGALDPSSARAIAEQPAATVEAPPPPAPEPAPVPEPVPAPPTTTVATTPPPPVPPPTAPPTTAPGPPRAATIEAAIVQWASDNLGVHVSGTCADATTDDIGTWCWVGDSHGYAIGPAFSEFDHELFIAGDAGSGWYVSGSSPIRLGS